MTLKKSKLFLEIKKIRNTLETVTRYIHFIHIIYNNIYTSGSCSCTALTLSGSGFKQFFAE